MKRKIIICVMLLFVLSISVLAEDINPYVVYGTGDLETVKQAVENGAGINHQDKTGYTPIIWAATFNSHPEAIIYLLDQGADPTIKNDKGRNALDCIKMNDKLINTEAYDRIVERVTREITEIEKTIENNKKAFRDLQFGDSKETINKKAREDKKIDASFSVYYAIIGDQNYNLTFDYFNNQM